MRLGRYAIVYFGASVLLRSFGVETDLWQKLLMAAIAMAVTLK